jgi:hypothetical protein
VSSTFFTSKVFTLCPTTKNRIDPIRENFVLGHIILARAQKRSLAYKKLDRFAQQSLFGEVPAEKRRGSVSLSAFGSQGQYFVAGKINF